MTSKSSNAWALVWSFLLRILFQCHVSLESARINPVDARCLHTWYLIYWSQKCNRMCTICHYDCDLEFWFGFSLSVSPKCNMVTRMESISHAKYRNTFRFDKWNSKTAHQKKNGKQMNAKEEKNGKKREFVLIVQSRHDSGQPIFLLLSRWLLFYLKTAFATETATTIFCTAWMPVVTVAIAVACETNTYYYYFFLHRLASSKMHSIFQLKWGKSVLRAVFFRSLCDDNTVSAQWANERTCDGRFSLNIWWWFHSIHRRQRAQTEELVPYVQSIRQLLNDWK